MDKKPLKVAPAIQKPKKVKKLLEKRPTITVNGLDEVDSEEAFETAQGMEGVLQRRKFQWLALLLFRMNRYMQETPPPSIH